MVKHETVGKDEITCPYCEKEVGDSWEMSDSGEIECYECGKIFYYQRNSYVTYESHGLCVQNGSDHKWGNPTKPHEFMGKWISGIHCENCGETKNVDVNQETKEVVQP